MNRRAHLSGSDKFRGKVTSGIAVSRCSKVSSRLGFSASLKSNFLWCWLHLQAEAQAYLLPASLSQNKGSPAFRLCQKNPLIELQLNNYFHMLFFEPIAAVRQKHRCPPRPQKPRVGEKRLFQRRIDNQKKG